MNYQETANKQRKIASIMFGIFGLIHVIIPWTNILFFHEFPIIAKIFICYSGAVWILIAIISYKQRS